MPKFPGWIFLSEREESDGSKYFLNDENQMDAIDGDGPSKVATYKLIKVNTLAKHIEFVQPTPRKRKK
jgi:hypothetical protein